MTGLIEQIEVNDVTYNVKQATAVEQMRLLHLIGGRVALNSAAASIQSEEQLTIDVPLLKGALITTAPETLEEITKIVLNKTIRQGESEPINIDQFRGKIDDWLTLIAKAIAANLTDFFGWLDAENEETRKKNANPVKPN